LTHRHHIFRKAVTTCTQSKKGVASYFKENRQSMGMDMSVMEAYLGDVHTLVGKIVDVSS